MRPVLVFFAVAALLGCLFRGIVELRLRRERSRRAVIEDGDLCQLEQASRITSVAIIASLACLGVAALALVLLSGD